MVSENSKKKRARTEEEKRENFEKILEAGKDLLINMGPKSLSMRKLAKNLNMTQTFLYTYVDKEGTLEKIDSETVLRIREITKNKIQYAGGISNEEQIIELAKYDIDIVIGMAYYEKRINFAKTFVKLLNFDKNNGLIPTIVKDENGQILMLAFGNKESVLKALKQRKGIYY